MVTSGLLGMQGSSPWSDRRWAAKSFHSRHMTPPIQCSLHLWCSTAFNFSKGKLHILQSNQNLTGDSSSTSVDHHHHHHPPQPSIFFCKNHCTRLFRTIFTLEACLRHLVVQSGQGKPSSKGFQHPSRQALQKVWPQQVVVGSEQFCEVLPSDWLRVGN